MGCMQKIVPFGLSALFLVSALDFAPSHVHADDLYPATMETLRSLKIQLKEKMKAWIKAGRNERSKEHQEWQELANIYEGVLIQYREDKAEEALTLNSSFMGKYSEGFDFGYSKAKVLSNEDESVDSDSRQKTSSSNPEKVEHLNALAEKKNEVKKR